jgi:hypothetical protein
MYLRERQDGQPWSFAAEQKEVTRALKKKSGEVDFRTTQTPPRTAVPFGFCRIGSGSLLVWNLPALLS